MRALPELSSLMASKAATYGPNGSKLATSESSTASKAATNGAGASKAAVPLWNAAGSLDDLVAAEAKVGSKVGSRVGSKKEISAAALKTSLREMLSSSPNRLAELLKEWDTDGSGDIDKDEFRVAVKALGFSAADDEIDEIFKEVDIAGSGAIEEEEVAEMLKVSAEETKVLKDTSDSAWSEALKRSILLKHLGKAELKYVKQSLKSIGHAAAQPVYAQGDQPEAMYIITRGAYLLTRTTRQGERKLRMLAPGDSFGSHELLFNETRAESVTCVEPGDVWVLNKRIFLEKLRISAPPKKALLEHVKAIPLFSQAEMPAAQQTQLCRAAIEVKFEAGTSICKQDEPARHIYAVIAGSCIATHAKGEFEMKPRAPAPPTHTQLHAHGAARAPARQLDSRGVPLPPCTANSFGESALYAEDALRMRGATVCAGPSGCTLLSFDAAHIEALLGYSLHSRSVDGRRRARPRDLSRPICALTAGRTHIDHPLEAACRVPHSTRASVPRPRVQPCAWNRSARDPERARAQPWMCLRVPAWQPTIARCSWRSSSMTRR